MATTPIILWCHPRSISSAFERAMMQRKDTRSYHEPLSMPFYYGKERQCRRYGDEKCKEVAGPLYTTGLEETLLDILESSSKGTQGAVPVGQKEGEACRYVFIKDMAQYIFPAATLKSLHPNSTVYRDTDCDSGPLPNSLDNPTVIPVDVLRRFKHTFLMRTPKKSVPSYWKCVQEGAAGFEYFDGAEAGYSELRLLYEWMNNPKSSFHQESESDRSLPGQVQAQPIPAPLIDASDLLADPPRIIGEYCASVGVPFDEGMLTWKSGAVEAFSSWQGYHTAAENSTGFKKETPASSEAEEAARSRRDSNASVVSDSSDASSNDERPDGAASKKKELPPDVLNTISDNIDTYNYLYTLRSFKTK